MTNQEILTYLRTIESNNGKNFNHPLITHGVNAGTHAIGNYGLTPATVNDTIKNSPQYAPLMQMQPDTEKAYLEAHPQDETVIANTLMDRLQQRYNGDPSKIAYAWNHGTYLNPSKITPDVIASDAYTNKFQKLSQKLGMNPKANPIRENIAQQTGAAQPEAVKTPFDSQSIRDFITDPNNPFNRALTSEDDSDEDDDKKKYSAMI